MRRFAEPYWRSVKWALPFVISYAVLAFAWSTLGFLTPTPPAHLHEYPLKGLAIEIGGHLLFGIIAAIPTLDLGLVLLCGGEAILIDGDHLLGALDFSVQTRLAHSIGFMLVGPIILGRLAANKRGLNRSVMGVTFASFLAHLSYDVFAGNGALPILDPLSIRFFVFPYWSWFPLEAGALAICAYVGFKARRPSRSPKPLKTPGSGGNR